MHKLYELVNGRVYSPMQPGPDNGFIDSKG